MDPQNNQNPQQNAPQGWGGFEGGYNPQQQPQSWQNVQNGGQNLAQSQGFYGNAQAPQYNQSQAPQYPQGQAPVQNPIPPQYSQPYPQDQFGQPVAGYQGGSIPQVPAHPVAQPQPQQGQNPYTVEYLETIAPKQVEPFWNKQKLILVMALVFMLFAGLGLMIFSKPRATGGDKLTQIYATTKELKEIAKKYQKKIHSSDLAADNSGIAVSLTTFENDLESYAESRGISLPVKSSDVKKSSIYQNTAEKLAELDKKIEDAYLSARMDEVYAREFGYQMIVLKTNIEAYIKTASSKNREPLEAIVADLETAIDKYDSFLQKN